MLYTAHILESYYIFVLLFALHIFVLILYFVLHNNKLEKNYPISYHIIVLLLVTLIVVLCVFMITFIIKRLLVFINIPNPLGPHNSQNNNFGGGGNGNGNGDGNGGFKYKALTNEERKERDRLRSYINNTKKDIAEMFKTINDPNTDRAHVNRTIEWLNNTRKVEKVSIAQMKLYNLRNKIKLTHFQRKMVNLDNLQTRSD